MNGNEPVRYAEWRPVPGRSYRLGPHLWRQIRRVRWFGWVALLIVVVALMIPDRGVGGFVSRWVATVAAVVFGISVRRGQMFRFVAPDPLPPDHFPVTVSFTIDGWEYGRQEGLLVLDDAWLLFEGVECSFSLKRRDVARAYRPPKSPLGFFRSLLPRTESRRQKIILDGKGIGITQLGVPGVSLATDWLETRLASWALDGLDVHTLGEAILPPRTPHPLKLEAVPAAEWLEIVTPVVVAAMMVIKIGLPWRGLHLAWPLLVLVLPVSAYFIVVACLRRRAMKKLGQMTSVPAQSKTLDPDQDATCSRSVC